METVNTNVSRLPVDKNLNQNPYQQAQQLAGYGMSVISVAYFPDTIELEARSNRTGRKGLTAGKSLKEAVKEAADLLNVKLNT